MNSPKQLENPETWPFSAQEIEVKYRSLINYQNTMRQWAKELLEKASASPNPLAFQEQAKVLEADAHAANKLIVRYRGFCIEMGINVYDQKPA